MKVKNYSVVLKSEPEGGYTAIVPSLPGCVTYGKTIEEAQRMVRDAIESYLFSLDKHNDEIPKGTLNSLLKEAGISREEIL
ncbi:antitoxin HicB [Candidatus Azambacteria bacterium RIFOXYA1_FULL_42_37]|nr:MAG: antitoxin HicB [Candidatus Azambacteria bacterium RIFOXYA1_FULL_42_37]